MRNILFFGAAGCGKTTSLVEQLRQKLENPHIKAFFLLPDRVPDETPERLANLPRSLTSRLQVCAVSEAARMQLAKNGVQIRMATAVIQRQAARRALGPYAHARAEKFLSTTVKISRLDPEGPDYSDHDKVQVSLYDDFLKARSVWNPTDVILAACDRIESRLVDRPIADLIVVDDAHALNRAEIEFIKANAGLGAELIMAFDDMQFIDDGWIESGLEGVMHIEESLGFRFVHQRHQYRLSPKTAGILHSTRNESAVSLRNDTAIEKARGSGQLEWFLMETPLEQISLVTTLARSSPATVVPWKDAEINLLEAALLVEGIQYFRTDGQSVLGMPAFRVIARALDAIIDPNEVTVFSLLAAVSMTAKKNGTVKQRVKPADLAPLIDQVVNRAKLGDLGVTTSVLPIEGDIAHHDQYAVELLRNVVNWIDLKQTKDHHALISDLFGFAMKHNPDVDSGPLAVLLDALGSDIENLEELRAQLAMYLDCDLPDANRPRDDALRISTLPDLRGRQTEALLIPFMRIKEMTDLEKRKICFAAGKASEVCIFFVDSQSGQDVTDWFNRALGAPACLS